MDINSGKPPSWTTVLWTAAKNCRKCRSCTFRWNFPMFFTDVVAMLCPCCSHDHPRVFPVLPVMFFPCCSRHVVPTRCWAVPMLFQTQMAENQAGWTVSESMGILWLVIVMLMSSFCWLWLIVDCWLIDADVVCFGSQFSSHFGSRHHGNCSCGCGGFHASWMGRSLPSRARILRSKRTHD